MISKAKGGVAVAIVVLLALWVMPAPLLPPHHLAEAVRSIFAIDWQMAYLAAAVGLQIAFYGSLGVLAAFAVSRAASLQGRLLQIGIVPMAVVTVALAIRSLKMGHLPIWINAVVPIVACLFGVGLGLGLLYQHGKPTGLVAAAVVGCALWGFSGNTAVVLRNATKVHLQQLVAVGHGLPSGEARFGALLQAAFAPVPGESTVGNAVQKNRAAILAWGIVVGHPRIALFVGFDPDDELVRQAAILGKGTTLRGHEDWPRHYALSAALAILEHPLISDAAGLMKEQLDALTRGSGFSFGDLAADRAGVRFALAATCSEAAAKAMQMRLQQGYVPDEFFTPIDFPENLSLEEFRRDFGSIGSERYRLEITRIEHELDRCSALAPPP